MTVCELCKELCDGLGPFCNDCLLEINEDEFEEFNEDIYSDLRGDDEV